jgi:hypothetical protein
MSEKYICRPTSPGSEYLKEDRAEFLSKGRGTVKADAVIERTKAKSQLPRSGSLSYVDSNPEIK